MVQLSFCFKIQNLDFNKINKICCILYVRKRFVYLTTLCCNENLLKHLQDMNNANFTLVFYSKFIVCSSYITLPALNETKLLNQYSRINCSSEDTLFSFEHSITLSGIRIFFDDVKQKPTVEVECHLNKVISTVKVIGPGMGYCNFQSNLFFVFILSFFLLDIL